MRKKCYVRSVQIVAIYIHHLRRGDVINLMNTKMKLRKYKRRTSFIWQEDKQSSRDCWNQRDANKNSFYKWDPFFLMMRHFVGVIPKQHLSATNFLINSQLIRSHLIVCYIMHLNTHARSCTHTHSRAYVRIKRVYIKQKKL